MNYFVFWCGHSRDRRDEGGGLPPSVSCPRNRRATTCTHLTPGYESDCFVFVFVLVQFFAQSFLFLLLDFFLMFCFCSFFLFVLFFCCSFCPLMLVFSILVLFFFVALCCLSCGAGMSCVFMYAQAGDSLSACSWMEVAGGNVRLSEEGRAQGASEFGTAKVSWAALRKKKWYFEVSPPVPYVKKKIRYCRIDPAKTEQWREC